VSERDHNDDQAVILDHVDDAILADPDAPRGTSRERSRGRWARIIGE
jgi:hypothetical protein